MFRRCGQVANVQVESELGKRGSLWTDQAKMKVVDRRSVEREGEIDVTVTI